MTIAMSSPWTRTMSIMRWCGRPCRRLLSGSGATIRSHNSPSSPWPASEPAIQGNLAPFGVPDSGWRAYAVTMRQARPGCVRVYTAGMKPDPVIGASILQAADLVRHRRWQEADAVLARVLAAHPDEPDGLQPLGLVREHQGRLTDAEQLLRQSVAARPKRPHVQVHLGRILAEAGKHREAIDLLQAAVQAQPDLFDGLVVLAQVQVTVGDLASAEENYRSALRLVPDSQVTLLGLGVLLNQRRRPAEAEPLLRAAAANTARPPSWQAKVARSLGLSLDLQGKTEEALEAWQRAIALDPTDAEAHRELNALLYRLGRTQDFLASYDAAARSLP